MLPHNWHQILTICWEPVRAEEWPVPGGEREARTAYAMAWVRLPPTCGGESPSSCSGQGLKAGGAQGLPRPHHGSVAGTELPGLCLPLLPASPKWELRCPAVAMTAQHPCT